MFIFLSLTIIVVAQARVIDKNCDGVILNNVNHEKEILQSNLHSPYQLAIDYDTNTLFFSYTNYSENDIFASAYINLKTNEFGTISGITGGFANAVDGKNHIIYLGGNNGIYTFDFDTKKAIFFGAQDVSIWQLFYKNRLYYSNYPDEIASFYENGESMVVPELIGTKAMLVAVDNKENIFCSNSSGLFSFKKGTGESILVGKYYGVNAFATDINGKLYFSTPEAIYSIDDNGVVTHIVSMTNIYGLAVEGDGNIIYADQDSIVRLRPTNAVCTSEVKKELTENFV